MNNSQGQLIEVYGVWYKPWWRSDWFYGAVITIACLIVIYYGYRFLKKKKKLRPDQEALQELYLLSLVNHATDKALHEAYYSLTMILKKYLIASYAISIKDKTDVEIVPLLNGILPENMIYLLQEFFDRSFHIKFAYDVASESMLKQDIEMLRTCIIELNKEKANFSRKN